jgi:Spy/CpxP family protein refolding chaperone
MNETSPAKRRAAVWVAAVFLLGAALGGVAGYIFAHRSVSANAPMTEQQKRAHRVEQLTQELGLNSDQQQQLDTILSQMHGEYKALHEQSDAQIDQARQKGRNQIRAILTAEQKPKFEEFLKHMDEERKRAEEERKRNDSSGGR